MLRADVEYKTTDAVDYLHENPVLPYNIIVFPKSISEFPEDVFENILDAFAAARFQFNGTGGRAVNTRRVHFLVSLRANDSIAPDDLLDKKRSDRLIEAMGKNGFVLDNAAEIVQGPAEDVHIYEQEEGFNYPKDIRDFMRELNEKEISKWPLLYTRYVCNRIMSFVRKEQP